MEPDENKYPFDTFFIDEDIKNKVSAICCSENMLVLGTEDGYLFSYEMIKDDSTG
jgi:hypothetical protein